MILFILSLISLAQAEICDVSTDPYSPVGARASVLQIGDVKEVSIVGSTEVSRQDRRALAELFWNFKKEKDDVLLERGKALLARYTQALAQEEQNLEFLRKRMELDPEYFVGVESTLKNLKWWQSVASEFYLNEFVLSRFRTDEAIASWKKLLLLTVGAPYYLQVSQPKLFGSIGLTPIDILAAKVEDSANKPVEPETPEDNSDEVRKRAEAATQRMLKSLSDNRKSLSVFKRFVKEVRPGSSFVRGKSDAQIRDYILKRTWKPVRGETRAWLDAQLAWIHAGKNPPAQKSETNTKKSEKPATMNVSVTALFSQINAPGTSGALFVSDYRFQAFVDALRQGCAITLKQPPSP